MILALVRSNYQRDEPNGGASKGRAGISQTVLMIPAASRSNYQGRLHMIRDHKVIAARGGFFAALLTNNTGSEAYASDAERSRLFKAAVRDGEAVVLAATDGESEPETVRVLRADHRERFGLTETEARGLARKLDRARARNARNRRSRR